MKNILERKILSEIRKYYSIREIVVLIGSRQVGKSTILWVIEKEIVKNDYGVFLDADFDSELLLLTSSKELLELFKLHWYNEKSNDTFVVFIDEFQKIKNIGTIIKGIYDRYENIKFFLSGSSSILINKAFGDSMMWRKVVFDIERLDFEEFLKFDWEDKLLKMYKNIQLWQSISLFKEQYQKSVEKHILFWWYPQVVLSKNQEYKIKKLDEILQSYIKKDILDFFHVEHSTNIIKLLKYLTQINSHLLKQSSISNTLWISNYNLWKYLSVLEETFFIKKLPPFFTNKIKSISKTQELFFSDTGIYNSILKSFNELELRIDTWRLIENFVFTELSKTKGTLDELFFYRDKNQLEVDFIIKRWEALLPIEVKSGEYEKIPANLKNFCKKNSLNKAILINKTVFERKSIDWLEVTFIPYFLTGRLFKLVNF